MQRKKDRRGGLEIMVSLVRLLGRLAWLIVFAVAGGYAGYVCAISVMVLGAACVAKIVEPALFACSLSVLILLTILAGLLRGLLRFLEQYNNHYIAFKLLACLRDRIFGALRVLAPAKLEGKQKGALISMLTSDVETLEVFYAHTISPVMIAILVNGSCFIFISIVADVRLGLIALVSYLLIGIVIPFTASAILARDGVAYRQQFADTSSYFLDSIRGITDIVLQRQEEKRGKVLSEQSANMNEKTVSMKEKTARTGSISNLLVSLTILLSSYVGISMVWHGEVSAGRLMIALVCLFSSFGPVLALAALPGNLTQTFAAGDRILDFMEEKPVVNEVSGGKDFEFEGLEVKNVGFQYDESGRSGKVLDHISLQIRKGEIFGIMGPSGCGKSTLLKMMLRFYDPDEGEISYSGIPLREINTAFLHRNVTMVSQDTYLFDDTILNNLLFVKPEATLAEVREACRKASIDEFIMSREQGYDTEVGLLGDALSAGERQRLGLARAFLSGAALILLDEVTSNVDAINEGIILKSLRDAAREAKGGKTIVLVSHRESTMAICDRKLSLS